MRDGARLAYKNRLPHCELKCLKRSKGFADVGDEVRHFLLNFEKDVLEDVVEDVVLEKDVAEDVPDH